MPGVHYSAIQSRVPMARVLELLGFVAHAPRATNSVGPVRSITRNPRGAGHSRYMWGGTCVAALSAVLWGTRIQLWATSKGMTVYEAAVDLCHQAGVEVPWIERWQAHEEAPNGLSHWDREDKRSSEQQEERE